MIRSKDKLTVLHDDNSSFTEYSTHAVDFSRDQITLSLHQSEDYLYVGYYKPISAVYIELDTSNTNAGELAGEYYNGSSFAEIDNYFDETKSLTRSGFIHWSRNQTDESKTTVNSTELYWYRFRPSATHSSTIIDGLNIVFSDDVELKREFFEIADFLPSGASSHILTHVACRDDIVQSIRRSGAYKESLSTGKLKDISAFDFLDIDQIRSAATYLALSKIFGNVSDDTDGHFRQKSKSYKKQYDEAMRLFYLDLDRDDDGIQDEEERLASATTKLLRR